MDDNVYYLTSDGTLYNFTGELTVTEDFNKVKEPELSELKSKYSELFFPKTSELKSGNGNNNILE